jgi:sialate O-acetylesterase
MFSQFTVSKLYSNHMAIQRNQDINVWGSNKKFKKITVLFNHKTSQTETNSEGIWKVTMSKMKAEGPFEMNIISGKQSIHINNILIGDVWICSGQSNMEFMVKDSDNATEEIAIATDLHSNYQQLF